jgi:hypothetical protein
MMNMMLPLMMMMIMMRTGRHFAQVPHPHLGPRQRQHLRHRVLQQRRTANVQPV